MSKILTDRIRPILDKLISPSQGDFILGQWIGENSILMNEILHTMKRRSSGSGIVGLKIDLVKAYDRVDWGLLTRIISKLAFSSKVNALILCCISPDSVELLLNGSVFSKTDMQRGLKQEDPLSLFLFTLYSELLSRMLLKLEREGRIHGIKIGRSSPAISHLLFADDICCFARQTWKKFMR